MKKTKTTESEDAEDFRGPLSFDQLPKEVSKLRDEIRDLKELIKEAAIGIKPKEPRQSITSITELAKFLNVARCTAQALKDSGRIPYIQYGKKLVIDPDKVLSSLNGYKPKRRKVKLSNEGAK